MDVEPGIRSEQVKEAQSSQVLLIKKKKKAPKTALFVLHLLQGMFFFMSGTGVNPLVCASLRLNNIIPTP